MKDWRVSTFWPEDNRERLAIVAVCSAILFVFGSDIRRVALRSRDGLRDSVRENMPIETEIDRARQLAASLVPDLRRNHEVIVREQVDVEELRADIQQSQSALKVQRDQLLALRSSLEPASSLSDAKSPATDIRQELRHRFATFQSTEATVDAKKQTLRYREESLAKAQAAQREMFRKKQELEVQALQFEARLKAMERNGIESHVVVDRDKLAHCEDLLRYLRKRLSIAERVSEFSDVSVTESRSSGREPQDDRIESEIDQHFHRDVEQIPFGPHRE